MQELSSPGSAVDPGTVQACSRRPSTGQRARRERLVVRYEYFVREYMYFVPVFVQYEHRRRPAISAPCSQAVIRLLRHRRTRFRELLAKCRNVWKCE